MSDKLEVASQAPMLQNVTSASSTSTSMSLNMYCMILLLDHCDKIDANHQVLRSFGRKFKFLSRTINSTSFSFQ